MPASLDPQASVALADALLACFHEVEKLTAARPYDPARIAWLLAGAHDAIEDAVHFDFEMKSTGRDTSASPQWIHMLMVREIEALSRLKGVILTRPDDALAERPVRVFFLIMVDICSLLAAPNLSGPLKEYFDKIEDRQIERDGGVPIP